MDILQRIERGERHIRISQTSAWCPGNIPDEMAEITELLRMAKLEAAAEKAWERHQVKHWDCHGVRHSAGCVNRHDINSICEWEDFCRLKGGVYHGR